MFSCSTCVRRALNNIAIDRPSIPTTLRPCNPKRTQQGLVSLSRNDSRNHATFDSLRSGHHRRVLRKTLAENKGLVEPNNRRKGPGAMTKGEIKDAIARRQNRERSLVAKNDDEDRSMQRKMKKEVDIYHNDPVKLANLVQKRLRSAPFNEVLNLVRASEGVVKNNIVSWNHLIDFAMSQAKTDLAWRVYNELKKRGQRPDAHTYTIMLRGFSQNIRNADSAERAVSVYQSIFAPNSPVEPSTIHTNAVLNVCARKRDMDSLWSIAGRLPTHGPGAPDCWTFTTILNAIQDDAIAKVAELMQKGFTPAHNQSSEERQKVIFEEALQDGRKLWADIIYRWRGADLVIDESLVCAMGRLILRCGAQSDFEQVFDLVDQTMNIQLKEGRRQQQYGSAQTEAQEDTSSTEVVSTEDKKTVGSGSMSKLPVGGSVIYATPSNNTLSMIMTAALGVKNMQAAKSYWHVLTTPNGAFKVRPDADNIICYLRVLRVSRASKTAFELLSQHWPAQVARKLYRRGSFVLAMSTCIRDKNNPNVFDTADKLLLLMQQKLEEVELGMFDESEMGKDMTPKERIAHRREQITKLDDQTFGEKEAQSEVRRSQSGVESLSIDPKALTLYIDLALATTKGWHEGLRKRRTFDEDGDSGNADEPVNQRFERDPKRNHALLALRRLDPLLGSIRRLAMMKMEELENVPQRALIKASSKKYNRFDKQVMEGRYDTRVGESLEDLVNLLRTAVSGYDRVIQVAERFEDEDLETLDKNMIQKFQDNKRRAAAFLTRTKEEMARQKANKFPNRNRSKEDDDDEDTDSHEDEASIARDIRRVHEDTHSDLSRAKDLSRRQRNERRAGVEQRMRRRGITNSYDYGVVGEDGKIEDAAVVEQRMRERAFGIGTNINYSSSSARSKNRRETRDGESEGENATSERGLSQSGWGREVFREMVRKELTQNAAGAAPTSAAGSGGASG